MHSRNIRRPKHSYKLNMSEDNEEETPSGVRAPIVGYEVVDRREKFTVYKMNVRSRGQSWFVFRRYTDFTRLNDKLQYEFPGFHFKLPSKRWFKNNFDPEFIEERAHGLQFFINNVMQHSSISKSDIVKEFLCLDDPPGPFDSLEESRAYCQQLEDEIEDMKERMLEMHSELNATKSQLTQARIQQEALVQSLQEERASNSINKDIARSAGTFKSLSSNSGDELDPWIEKLTLSAHSKTVQAIKPIARRNIMTSTPEKEPELKSFPTNHNLTTMAENIPKKQDELSDIEDTTVGNLTSSNHSQEIVNSFQDSQKLDEFESANSGTDDELLDIHSSNVGKSISQHSSKRDSGIMSDTGLSPLTTNP